MFGKKQQSVYFVNCPERSWQCCLTQHKGPKFVILQSRPWWWWWEGGGGGGGGPYNGLYREAPLKRGTFLRLQVNERVGISLVEVYEREGKSVVYLSF